MCNFKSAVVTPNGNIYHLDGIDSHEDIINYYKLNDTKLGNLVRIEYRPIQGKEADLASYELHIDEVIIPEWFTEGMKVQVIKRMKAIINKYIIKEDVHILPLGLYILKDNVTIEYANYALIKHAGSAKIENAGYALIEYADNALIQNANCATIRSADSAIIEYAGSAKIENARYAKIEIAEYATIENAEYAKIEYAEFAIIENAGHALIKHAGRAIIKNAESATII